MAALAEVNDMPPALALHVRDHVFAAQKRPVQVGIKHIVPETLVLVFDQRPARITPLEVRDHTGIVDQYINAPKTAADLSDHCFDLMFKSHVATDGNHLPLKRADILHGRRRMHDHAPDHDRHAPGHRVHSR